MSDRLHLTDRTNKSRLIQNQAFKILQIKYVYSMAEGRHTFLTLFVITLIVFVASACSRSDNDIFEPGISKSLAQARKGSISSLSYQLYFKIPEEKSKPIPANVSLNFKYKKSGQPLLLDFNSKPENIRSIKVNNESVDVVWEREHILIEEQDLIEGSNNIAIEFIAGEQSLNRNPEYLYTLFVPERASTCFPLFDQPDLKATYELTLDVPQHWAAVANGSLKEEKSANGAKTFVFTQTKPISSYLFAFAAGQFKKVTKSVGRMEITMYHRETDSVKVNKNIEEIFEWHQKSLKWMKDYTQIDYQFGKLDFVLIPSFQYGGMEHPGSIFYKASSLMLDQSATLNQQLGRARLIAHEVAHMWFGNLVTMKWFDDVWLKEVFANLMASKIADPEFSEINHDLKFLMSHYPAVYAVDRSMGTHAVEQELNNLKDAGSLYGAIIYQKAPIVMKMLEDNVGEQQFRAGMRKYLNTYQYGNATWDDLLAILSEDTDYTIGYWNKKWVQTAGMPTVFSVINIKNSKIKKMRVSSRIPETDHYDWPQQLEVLIGFADSSFTTINTAINENIDALESKPYPEYIFTNFGGTGYGYFKFGPNSKEYFLANISSFNELQRAAFWLNYNEALLRKDIDPAKIMDALIVHLPKEQNAIIAEYMLQMIEAIYWRMSTEEDRQMLAPKLEGLLLNMAIGTQDAQIKSSYFNTLRSVVLTKGGVDLLMKIWEKDMLLEGLELSENDYVKLAYALALRKEEARHILNKQFERMENPDRKRRFSFVRKALASSVGSRDLFFESLKNPLNRENEAWVLEAIGYLHHPLKVESSLKYIKPSLELLEEIKLTGDIFFPKRWLDQTLNGHSSAEADAIVRQFLFSHNSYPKDLKNKILQAADPLFRAVNIKAEFKKGEQTNL